MSAEFFEETLQKQGYFLYIPESALPGLREGKFDEIESFDLPKDDSKEWGALSTNVKNVWLMLRGSHQNISLLPKADAFDSTLWNMLCENFRFKRGNGFLRLSNCVVSILSAEIAFGVCHAPGGNVYTDWHKESGQLLILKQNWTEHAVVQLREKIKNRINDISILGGDNWIEILKLAEYLDIPT